MRNLHAVFLAVDPHLHAVHTFTFGGTHGGSTTPENGFLCPDSLRWSVSDAPRDNRQYHNEYDDSNFADETGESLENPRKSKATESDSVLTFLFFK